MTRPAGVPLGGRSVGNGRGSAWKAATKSIPAGRGHAESAGRGVPAALDQQRGAGLERRGDVEVDGATDRAAQLVTDRVRPPPPDARACPPGARRSGPRSPAPRRRRAARSVPCPPGRRPWRAPRPPPRSSARGVAGGPLPARRRCARRRPRSSSSISEIASSASAIRPAALMRGAMPNARSRAVGWSGDSHARASSARRPARRVSASSASPSRTIARLSPVIGARSATVPMAATAARSLAASAAARQQRGGELVRQAGAGQVGIGIGAVGPMRVDHRHRPRQVAGGQVVIGHDHVHARGSRACSTSATFTIPQSQVMTSVTPAAARRSRPAFDRP